MEEEGGGGTGRMHRKEEVGSHVFAIVCEVILVNAAVTDKSSSLNSYNKNLSTIRSQRHCAVTKG